MDRRRDRRPEARRGSLGEIPAAGVTVPAPSTPATRRGRASRAGVSSRSALRSGRCVAPAGAPPRRSSRMAPGTTSSGTGPFSRRDASWFGRSSGVSSPATTRRVGALTPLQREAGPPVKDHQRPQPSPLRRRKAMRQPPRSRSPRTRPAARLCGDPARDDRPPATRRSAMTVVSSRCSWPASSPSSGRGSSTTMPRGEFRMRRGEFAVCQQAAPTFRAGRVSRRVGPAALRFDTRRRDRSKASWSAPP